MKLSIERSKKYVEEERIKTGTSTPMFLEVDVDPVELTEEARRSIILIFGEYPDVLKFTYTNEYQLNPHARWGTQELCADVSFVSPGEISDLILQAVKTVKEKRAQWEQENAEREKAEKQKQREKLALDNAAVDAFLADPDARPEAWSSSLIVVGGRTIYDRHPRGKELFTAHKERLAIDNAKRLEEAEAAEARKTAQIKAWVKLYGTISQRERLDAGMLPDIEVLNGMRDAVFSPFASFDRYARLKEDDVPCECNEYDSPSFEFDVEDAESATEQEFNTLRQITETIRKEHPEASVVLRSHTGECSECERSVSRRSVLVTVTVGEFTFSREYAA